MAKLLILVTLVAMVLKTEGVGIDINLSAVFRLIGGNECYETIERGFAQMEEMADNNREELPDMFHLCNEVIDELDIQIFFSAMSEVFLTLAQIDQIAKVAGVCNVITDDSHESDAAAIAAAILHYLGEFDENEECIDIDNDNEIRISEIQGLK